MNKQELKILEKAFTQEIESALSGGLDIIQTRSKVAVKLAEDGYLEKVVRVVCGQSIPTMHFEGYVLTHTGRMAYCASCGEE